MWNISIYIYTYIYHLSSLFCICFDDLDQPLNIHLFPVLRLRRYFRTCSMILLPQSLQCTSPRLLYLAVAGGPHGCSLWNFDEITSTQPMNTNKSTNIKRWWNLVKFHEFLIRSKKMVNETPTKTGQVCFNTSYGESSPLIFFTDSRQPQRKHRRLYLSLGSGWTFQLVNQLSNKYKRDKSHVSSCFNDAARFNDRKKHTWKTWPHALTVPNLWNLKLPCLWQRNPKSPTNLALFQC